MISWHVHHLALAQTNSLISPKNENIQSLKQQKKAHFRRKKFTDAEAKIEGLKGHEK